ncbi:MAG: gliding motility protein GldB [Bacteroidaceae bacterium]|nr:gliding motility protein GldB [Bacteroidaceae bacterium]
MSRKSALFVLVLLLVLLCGVGIWGLGLFSSKKEASTVHIDRFDRVLDEYVSLGSYTALQRMNTQYPRETKLLIEDVLSLGRVDDPNVERELRRFYLDSTVQMLLDEVHRQYTDLSDLEADFGHAFEKLKEKDPAFRVPHIYTQISCLNQSIVIGDTLIGISLDKYLGEDFPLYKDFYTPEQRAQMNRNAIVSDAVSLYLQFHK